MQSDWKKWVRGVGLAAGLTLTAHSAQAVVIGNDAIDRATSDTWSNFVLALTTEAFTPTGGLVTDWNVYANNAGTLGLLILRNTSGTTYEVVGADFETASAGLNTFSFSPDTGSAVAQAGDILGLFIGSSKVDFSFSGADAVRWCGSSGCISDVGTQLAVGSTVNFTGSGARVYSANAVYNVPESATLLLVALGLMGAGWRRRA